MATINDVAKLAGVSTATVSRSFGTSHPLNPETRRRVLEAADRLRYRPRAGRIRANIPDSRRQPSLSIGFQFFASQDSDTPQTNAFYGPVLAGAQAEADLLGMHMLLHTTQRHRLDQKLPQMIQEQAVDGMLLVGTADPEILELFVQYVPHIVLVDNRDSTGRYDSFVSDGFAGGYMATEHLLKLGHRRIGFLGSRTVEVTLTDRLWGYVAALFDAGIVPNPKDIIKVQNTVGLREDMTAVDEIVAAIDKSDRPTAFFAAYDCLAIRAMQACRRHRLKIPEDISMVGFDDIDFSSHTHPTLSTICVDKELLGRLAVRRLHRRMTAPAEMQREPPLRRVLPVSLIERESTSPRG